MATNAARSPASRGNNNAYCQDNALTWLDWRLDDERRSLLDFTKKLTALRRAHPVLRRSTFFKGRALRGSEVTDICWLRHDGAEMSDADWSNAETRSLGVFYAGEGLDDVDENGQTLRDDDLLLLVNSHTESIDFSLAFDEDERCWQLLLDTSNDGARESQKAAKRPRSARRP